MSGKIFRESADLSQDQARVLFNYYKQAAEAVVAQEEAIEQQVASLNAARADLQGKLDTLWYWFLTIILFFMYFIKKNEIEQEINEIDNQIEMLRQQYQNIFRDYRVTRLGVAYVPVAGRIKNGDKSFIVDYTGSVPSSKVTMQTSRHTDLLAETIARLEKLSADAPLVETSADIETIDTDDYSTSIQHINQHDYLGALDRSLRTVCYCMTDVDTASVELPLAMRGSGYVSDLDRFATDHIPAGAPVFSVYDPDRLKNEINSFEQINAGKERLSSDTEQFESVIKSLMSAMAGSVQAISALKTASVDKVVFESNKILYQILKAPYNHYSPHLEHEEIERIRHEDFDYSEDVQNYEPFNLKQSSRVRFNPHTGLWTAEDGSTTNMPFGVHQIYEEIVAPMVQNLMNENRIERLKIYNHIKDQKLSYLTKWHQDTEAFYRANRAESADIINLMQEGLREYVAAYNTLLSLKRTEESMNVPAVPGAAPDLDATVVTAVENSAETAAAFELQASQFQQAQTSFEQFMEQIKDDIERRAEMFGHVEYYDAKLRDGHPNEAAVASSEIGGLDTRRRNLVSVNPLFAKKSQLPPEPNVMDIAREHISLNLPAMARAALDALDAAAPADGNAAPAAGTPENPPAIPDNENA